MKKADNALPTQQEEYSPKEVYVYTYAYTVHTHLQCERIYGNPDRVKVSDFNHTYIDSHGNKRAYEYCR